MSPTTSLGDAPPTAGACRRPLAERAFPAAGAARTVDRRERSALHPIGRLESGDGAGCGGQVASSTGSLMTAGANPPMAPAVKSVGTPQAFSARPGAEAVEDDVERLGDQRLVVGRLGEEAQG